MSEPSSFARLRALLGVAAALALTAAMILLGYLMIALGLVDRALPMAPYWARGCLRLLGLELVVSGREHLPPRGQGFIAAASHASALDVLIYTAIVPWDMRYLAKRELERLPLFAGAFRRSGNVFVDRGGSPETREQLNRALREHLDRPIFIYPEGTRTRDGKLLPLKRGIVHLALATGFPILPMISRGAFESLPKGQWLPRPGRIEIHIGAPLSTAAWTVANIDAQVAELRSAMTELIETSAA